MLFIHSIGAVWLTTLHERGGVDSAMGIRTLNLRRAHVRKRWEIGLNQSLIYIEPLSPSLKQFFLLSPLQHRRKK